MRYSHLLSPGQIGSLRLRNRIVMAAMGSDLSGDDGIAGDRIRNYYEARARGGCGLIITEAVPVRFPHGFSRPHAIALQNDLQRKAAEALVQAIHRHGARVAMQLNHHGPLSRRDMLQGRPLLVPSLPPEDVSDINRVWLPEEQEIRSALNRGMPPVSYHVLGEDDIAELVEAFATCAAHVKEVGADAIEVHAGHGFLLSSFLSPRFNRREDRYGGSAENRARFLIEVVRAIRQRVGPDFPVWCKIDAEDRLVSDGITPTDARVTVELLKEVGASAICLSTNAPAGRSIALTESNIPDKPEGMINAVRAVGRDHGLPVIAAGRMEPDRASTLIATGVIDFAAFGRKLLADPEMPNKLLAGRESAVRPCMYCYACISQLSFDKPVKCAANPETGFEAERAVRVTRQARRVVVVGGGPGGMEAARRLAHAGHRVTLFEARRVLGGTMRYAALAYPPNEKLLRWLVDQTLASGAEIRLGTQVEADHIRAQNPDLCVVATGALRPRMAIPGSDLPHVLSGDDLQAMFDGTGSGLIGKMIGVASRFGLTERLGLMRQLTQVWMPFDRQVVILGAGLVGLELAEFLVHRRRTVAVLDDASVAGAGLQVIRRARVLHELETLGVPIFTGCSGIEIGPRHVQFRDNRGDLRRIEAGTVIQAAGVTENPSLADSLERLDVPTVRIGDCRRVGYIEGALEDAARLCSEL